MRCHLLRSILLFVLAVPALPAHAEPLPELRILEDEAGDQDCAQRRHYEIQPAWRAELRARLPAFRALWAEQGPGLMQAVVSLTGKPLPAGPVDARLTLCDQPSNAFGGISVNMRYALHAFTPTPVPLRVKLDTLFHELLHGFVASQLPASSPLLAAASGENACVRNHLHLLALQKAVLLSLHQEAALAQLVAVDQQLPSGCYRRAWALVDASPERYRDYVAELAAAR